MPPPSVKRFKVKCKVKNCPRPIFDNDYRLTHNRMYHPDYIQNLQGITYEKYGAPQNPFAISSAKRAKISSELNLFEIDSEIGNGDKEENPTTEISEIEF